MERLLKLYQHCERSGVVFFHGYDLPGDNDACTIEMGGTYGLFIDQKKANCTAKEVVAVAHECGHMETGATHKLSSPYDIIQKHENLADRWAIERLIPRSYFKTAIASEVTEPWELAELFNVSQPFMEKAISYYHMLDLMEKEKGQPTAASVDWPEEM